MEPLDLINIELSTEFMHKFVTWLNDWMLLDKTGLSKRTYFSCIQTSESFPLLIQHLLEMKGLEYILTENIQLVLLENVLGRYHQLSGANCFGDMKKFLDAEKLISVKSLIKFSGYTMTKVNVKWWEIMENGSVKVRTEVEHCRNIIKLFN